MSDQTNYCPTCEHHAREAERYRKALEEIDEEYSENPFYCGYCDIQSSTHYAGCPFAIAHRALHPNPEGTP